jgi:hypothetical protein
LAEAERAHEQIGMQRSTGCGTQLGHGIGLANDAAEQRERRETGLVVVGLPLDRAT